MPARAVTRPPELARSEFTSARLRVARVVTEVLAPAPVVTVLLLSVAIHTASSLQQAILWGLLSAGFAAFIPLAYVVRAVRRRQLTDHHVRVREQRAIPLLVGVASVLGGFLLLGVLGAPQALVALIAAMVAGLSASLLVTLFWKLSIHTAVVAGAVVIVVLVFGEWFVVLTPLVALAGWSRVELGDHTPAQVVVGAGLGALIAGLIFPMLR